MSLDEASLDHYARYSPFPRPHDSRLEPSAEIIYLDPLKSFSFKTNPDYFPLSTYPAGRHSSIDTMTSTQSDDMEAFQRLSDQYQPEVAVGQRSLARNSESALTLSGAIDRAEATDCSIDHRVCQRRSCLQNEDGRECSQSWNLELC
jgi:hypothetical protein